MTIHHSQIKKAEKMGIQLGEEGDSFFAFWPKRALKIYGTSPGDAMAQAQAALVVMDGDDYRIVPNPDADHRLVDVVHDGLILAGGPMPPVAAHKIIFMDKTATWEDADDGRDNSDGFDADNNADSGGDGSSVPTIERINGVAIDGKVAYSEGTPAGDCPYSSEGDEDGEYENFERWNVEWDAAADEHEEEDAKGGSVVSEKYRAKYAEAGHPTHCGDWLAETLNEICLNKAGTNLELFEEICGLNGVDTSKYKRSGVGWEGRIRMTGRNLMARKVYVAGGILVLPLTINGGVMKAPAEWMNAQRYKMPKADQDKPVPTSTIAVATS